MAVTDWKTPGSIVNADRDARQGWVNTANAKVSNNQYTTCDIAKLNYSDWLRATDFDFSAIPAGSTIDGIESKVEGHGEIADKLGESAVYLRKTAGQVGDSKAGITFWGTSDSLFEHGGAADDWNAGLVDTDIDADFGLDFSASNVDNADARTAYVDCISIRIYYTAPAEGEDHRRGSFFKMF